jgi:hypothetical protein
MISRSAFVGVGSFLAGMAVVHYWPTAGGNSGIHASTEPVPPSRISEPVLPEKFVAIPHNASVAVPVPATYAPALPGTEFDALLDDKRVAIMHSRLQAEALDPAWAAIAETKLRGLFGSRPEFTLSSIECRATLCEARVFGANIERSWFPWRINRSIYLGNTPVGSQKLVNVWSTAEQQGSNSAAVVYMKFGSGLARPDLKD